MGNPFASPLVLGEEHGRDHVVVVVLVDPGRLAQPQLLVQQVFADDVVEPLGQQLGRSTAALSAS